MKTYKKAWTRYDRMTQLIKDIYTSKSMGIYILVIKMFNKNVSNIFTCIPCRRLHHPNPKTNSNSRWPRNNDRVLCWTRRPPTYGKVVCTQTHIPSDYTLRTNTAFEILKQIRSWNCACMATRICHCMKCIVYNNIMYYILHNSMK